MANKKKLNDFKLSREALIRTDIYYTDIKNLRKSIIPPEHKDFQYLDSNLESFIAQVEKSMDCILKRY